MLYRKLKMETTLLIISTSPASTAIRARVQALSPRIRNTLSSNDSKDKFKKEV
jgi:hypothetical protein